ncbi:MAG: D-tyrosyl-tRNA(Tyr) deacylase [Bacilli bacterium]|nr:D-tyrosyl-tRNA(Tyr) deacylase [Bacilli bacterium]
MKVVVQRVIDASVSVDNKIVGKVDKGYLLLVGFTHTDTFSNCEAMAKKIKNLRIFEDENGKMNLNIASIDGKILSVSQFTLYGDCTEGNRPSFVKAMAPDMAKKLYLYFNEALRNLDVAVEEGIFQADMKVKFTNDGPVTIILEN